MKLEVMKMFSHFWLVRDEFGREHEVSSRSHKSHDFDDELSQEAIVSACDAGKRFVLNHCFTDPRDVVLIVDDGGLIERSRPLPSRKRRKVKRGVI